MIIVPTTKIEDQRRDKGVMSMSGEELAIIILAIICLLWAVVCGLQQWKIYKLKSDIKSMVITGKPNITDANDQRRSPDNG